MIPANDTAPFEARTLSLSHCRATRPKTTRAAWLQGFIAGLSAAVFGTAATVIALGLML